MYNYSNQSLILAEEWAQLNKTEKRTQKQTYISMTTDF